MLSNLYHFFVPRESNNHRAKLLHHQTLLGLIALLLLGNFTLTFMGQHAHAVLGSAADISILDLLSQTNTLRVQNGLGPLTMNSELTSAATAKGQDMFTHNYWAHNSPEGLTPWVFIKGANYDYLYAGENLARGFNSATDVINAWMASPGHRENMLSSHYKDIGFAVLSGSLTGEDTTLVVEEFGSKNTAAADTASEQAPLQQVAGAQITTIPLPPLSTASAPAAINHPVGITPSPIMFQGKAVAAAGIIPLTNKKSIAGPIAISVLLLLITVLLIDIIVIERKKIVRLFTHNLDHILYLVVLLIIILILGRGVTI